jgi:4-amino-4-deoxy-L-arabinose transferase-like glycosyltransferase
MRVVELGHLSLRQVILIAYSLCGALLTLLCTAKYGPGLTPDSTTYLATAESLVAGRGFFYPTGTYLEFPPLYPLLLAGTRYLGLGFLTTARYLDALCIVVTVYAAGALIQRVSRSTLVLVLGLTIVVTATPILLASTFALTEMPFIALFTLFMLTAVRFIDQGNSRDLLLAAVLAALACLTRYVGIAIVAMGIGAVLLSERRHADKLKDATLFCLISTLPLCLWLARNYLGYDTLTGDRPPSDLGLADIVRQVADTTSAWLLPAKAPLILRVTACIGVATALTILSLRSARSLGASEARQRLTTVTFIALCAGIYTVWLVITTSQTALQEIGPRYLAPAYIPCLLLALWWLDSALSAIHGIRSPRRRRPLTAACAVAVAAVLLTTTTDGLRQFRHQLSDGAGGYANDLWQASPLTASIRERGIPPGAVYCNDPYACYALAGLAAKQSPRRHKYHSIRSEVDDRQRLDAVLDAGTVVYLVYFVSAERFFDFVHPIEELTAWYHLQPVTEIDGGGVYRVTRKVALASGTSPATD